MKNIVKCGVMLALLVPVASVFANLNSTDAGIFNNTPYVISVSGVLSDGTSCGSTTIPANGYVDILSGKLSGACGAKADLNFTKLIFTAINLGTCTVTYQNMDQGGTYLTGGYLVPVTVSPTKFGFTSVNDGNGYYSDGSATHPLPSDQNVTYSVNCVGQ